MLNSISEREKYFEELDKNSEIKHHVLYIEPDYDALLWENDTVICGSECYGFDFQGSDNESDVYEVELEYDQEADNWLNQFYESCLIPTATGKIELEELVHLFDWKEFHLKGLQIALRIANQLPDNCELWYTTPFEDISGSLPNAILIKKAK